MRLVVQRVSRAKVSVAQKTIGQVNEGLFVLVGVAIDDDKEKAQFFAKKLINLRIMSDEKGKMNLSVRDINAQILVVPQFTLLGDTSRGNRPSFVKAGGPKHAEAIYNYFVSQLRKSGVKVATGKFGTLMKIEASLDGPVTILVE